MKTNNLLFFVISLNASFLISLCNPKNEKASNNTNDSVVAKEIAPVQNEDVTNADTLKKTIDLSKLKISKIYTDWWVDQESGDMGGTAMITFKKLTNGDYEAYVEQRYGTEGMTSPKQKLNNLRIDEEGNISFEANWYLDDSSGKTKHKVVYAKGKITKSTLKFEIDQAGVEPYNLSGE